MERRSGLLRTCSVDNSLSNLSYLSSLYNGTSSVSQTVKKQLIIHHVYRSPRGYSLDAHLNVEILTTSNKAETSEPMSGPLVQILAQTLPNPENSTNAEWEKNTSDCICQLIRIWIIVFPTFLSGDETATECRTVLTAQLSGTRTSLAWKKHPPRMTLMKSIY